MKSLKAISALLAVAALAVVSLAPVAKAQSTTDVNALIAQLQAQIASLKAQLGQGTATTGTATYTVNLTLGSTGSDVSALQQYLIDHGYLSITAPTGKFGALTKAAVMKLQTALGVPSTGFFGPMTRAALNATLVVVPPTTPGTGTSTSTTSTPATSGITTPGAEGSLTLVQSGAVAANQQINLNSSNQAVAALDLKADTSDMNVTRFDVHFNYRPWLYLTNVSITSGGQTLASVQPTASNVTEVSVGTDYLVRFSGLNLIVPKQTTKTVVVTVSTPNAISSNYPAGGGIFWPAGTDVIRATDGAGNSTAYSYANGGTSNSPAYPFTIKSTLTQGTMVLGLNANTPNPQVIQVSNSNQTQNVEVLRFNVKAQNNAGQVNQVVVEFASNGSSTQINGVAGVVHLVDENGNVLSNATMVQGTTNATGTATFTLTNNPIQVAQDQTRTLKVTVDAQQASSTNGGTLVPGSTLSATVNPADITAQDANYNNINGGNLTGSAQGYTTYFYVVAPSLALTAAPTPSVSATSTNASLNQAAGSFTVTVTAQGGDIYVKNLVGFTVTSTAKAVSGTMETPSGSGVTAGSWGWKVSQGSTATFKVDYQMNNAGATGAGFVNAWMNGFVWNTVDSGSGATTWTNILGLGSDTAPSNLTNAMTSPTVYLYN